MIKLIYIASKIYARKIYCLEYVKRLIKWNLYANLGVVSVNDVENRPCFQLNCAFAYETQQFGFQTRSVTNQLVQSQKKARNLKFRI